MITVYPLTFTIEATAVIQKKKHQKNILNTFLFPLRPSPLQKNFIVPLMNYPTSGYVSEKQHLLNLVSSRNYLNLNTPIGRPYCNIRFLFRDYQSDVLLFANNLDLKPIWLSMGQKMDNIQMLNDKKLQLNILLYIRFVYGNYNLVVTPISLNIILLRLKLNV